MLDSIKHITDDNFFFREDSAQVHCVCNTIQLSENVIFAFPRFARQCRSTVTWGGIVGLKHLLIAYFIGNISVKKYQNSFTWDVFW